MCHRNAPIEPDENGAAAHLAWDEILEKDIVVPVSGLQDVFRAEVARVWIPLEEEQYLA